MYLGLVSEPYSPTQTSDRLIIGGGGITISTGLVVDAAKMVMANNLEVNLTELHGSIFFSSSVTNFRIIDCTFSRHTIHCHCEPLLKQCQNSNIYLINFL